MSIDTKIENLIKIIQFSKYLYKSKNKKELPTDLFTDALGFFDKNTQKLITDNLISEEKWRNDKKYKQLIASEDFFVDIDDFFDNTEFKKTNGVVFTPKWLSELLTKKSIEYYEKYNSTYPNIVGDLSSGSGTFINQLTQQLPSTSKVYGNDLSKEYCFISRLLNPSNNVYITNFDALLDLNNSSQISLFNNINNIPTSDYDLIVGNPPYVSTQNINSEYAKKIRERYSDIIEGNFDLSIPFIFNTVESLKPNGIGALVLSSKFTSSNYGKKICKILSRETQIIEIIDFGDSQVFKGKTTYTCCIIFRKLKSNELNNINKVKVFSFPSGTHWDSLGTSLSNATVNLINQEKLYDHPWQLHDDFASTILRKLNSPKNSVPINVIFPKIIQGIRTGCKDFFIIPDESSVSIETDLLKNYVDGSNIKAYEIEKGKQSIIWPYELKNEKIVLKNYEETDYPLFFERIKIFEEQLKKRKVDNSEKIYQYSRNQNLNYMSLPKIFIREMMPSSQFAADLNGEYVFSSGYSFINENLSTEELKFWVCILNTPILEFQLRSKCTQLHSGWFRVLKKHLENITLPNFTKEELNHLFPLTNKIYSDENKLELIHQLNLILKRKYNLTDEQFSFIHQKLSDYHSISLTNKYKKSTGNKVMSNIHSETVDILEDSYYQDIPIEDRKKYLPVEITQYNKFHVDSPELRQLVTFQKNKGDIPIHNWYHYTQGYSRDLIQYLLNHLGCKKYSNKSVYDPFVGSGTTVLACKELGLSSYGSDISPLMTWITKLKTSEWSVNDLKNAIKSIDFKTIKKAEIKNLLFTDYLIKAYSEKILLQIVGWKDYLKALNINKKYKDFVLLALISILEEISLIRKHGSHYRFLNKEDNVGVNKLNIKTIDDNVSINGILEDKVISMINDLDKIKIKSSKIPEIYTLNARDSIPKIKVDYVITSPPYLNRNNYFSQQKAEISIADILSSELEYKKLVKDSYKSHVEASFKNDVISSIPEVNKILQKVVLSENNNAKIPHMICGYFDDLNDTLTNLRSVLKPGAKLAFVVANSRWGGVVIPVDHLLTLIAEQLGYKLNKILVARYKGNSPQQMAKFGKIPVRESVVILEYPK